MQTVSKKHARKDYSRVSRSSPLAAYCALSIAQLTIGVCVGTSATCVSCGAAEPQEANSTITAEASNHRLPRICFLRPIKGERFDDLPIYIQVEVADFRLVSPDKPHVSDRPCTGYICYSLDDYPVYATCETQLMIGKLVGNSHLPAGTHVLRAELVDTNGKVLEPAVAAVTSVYTSYPADPEVHFEETRLPQVGASQRQLSKMLMQLAALRQQLFRLKNGMGFVPRPDDDCSAPQLQELRPIVRPLAENSFKFESGTATDTATSTAPKSPSIEILTPRAGDHVKDYPILVEVAVRNCGLKPPVQYWSAVCPSDAELGHIHYSFDNSPYIATSNTKILIEKPPRKSLPAGRHVLRAELVHINHRNRTPRVFAEVPITCDAPERGARQDGFPSEQARIQIGVLEKEIAKIEKHVSELKKAEQQTDNRPPADVLLDSFN